jgi:hypothetical protein
MSTELKAFLAAEDLDQLLDAREHITALDPDDEALVRSVVKQWQDLQGVSNLLFHPTLLPEDIRLASLFRALAERRVAYYVLAAVVGFQNIDAAALSVADRRRVAEQLLTLIRQTSGVLAQRATVSLQGFVTEEFAPQIFWMWAHADDTVWHNLRVLLFRLFQSRGIEPFAAAAQKSGLGKEVQRRLVEEFTESVTNPPQGCNNAMATLFAYIPNLREVEQTK